MKRSIVLCLALALVLPGAAQASAPATAAELTQLFRTYGDTGGAWNGGDSTYSVPLPDGRIAWLFSDTFIGPINEDGSRPTNDPLINNSIVVQDGDAMTTLYTDGFPPRAYVQPSNGVGYYWFGDGSVEGDKLRVFVLRFTSLGVTFQQLGVDIATFSLPSMALDSVTPCLLCFSPAPLPVSYGSAITEDADYTYVYGSEDLHADKFLHVARAPRGGLLGAWQFWDGSAWTDNPLTSARLVSGIANEVSVTHDGSTYRLIAQVGKNIVSMSAPSPVGPWGERTAVFTTPEYAGARITYNAHEHPEFDRAGTILITYNVNSTNINELYQNAENYRPRFIEVPAS